MVVYSGRRDIFFEAPFRLFPEAVGGLALRPRGLSNKVASVSGYRPHDYGILRITKIQHKPLVALGR
jgi:hypothetical protein